MITTANIYKSIRYALLRTFQNVRIKDLKNIEAPCFYIQYVNSSDREVANDTINTETAFNIVYFSSEQTLIDLTEKETSLRQIFKKPLLITYKNAKKQTKTRYLQAEEMSSDFDENEYTVVYSINFNFYQDAEVENPYNEELNDNLMEILDIG